MQTTIYKMQIFCIFYQKYLRISKKSCTFAPELINICFKSNQHIHDYRRFTKVNNK